MPSMRDWAAKAAARICSEQPRARNRLREERIAAIIVAHAKPLLDILDAEAVARLCTDPTLSGGEDYDVTCGECENCKWNARLTAAFAGRTDL